MAPVDPQGSPWPQIGLPALFQACPVAWRFGTVNGNGPAGAVTMHVLIIDSANGT